MQFLLRTPSSVKLMHSVSMHARIDSLRVNAIVFFFEISTCASFYQGRLLDDYNFRRWFCLVCRV